MFTETELSLLRAADGALIEEYRAKARARIRVRDRRGKYVSNGRPIGHPPKPLSAEERGMIASFYESGLTIWKICRMTGLNWQRVMREFPPTNFKPKAKEPIE